jgi:hypothetical protein
MYAQRDFYHPTYQKPARLKKKTTDRSPFIGFHLFYPINLTEIEIGLLTTIER